MSILIVINIAIGISLLESGDYRILWLFVIFITIWIVLQVILFITYLLRAYKAPEKGNFNNDSLMKTL